MKQSGIDVVRIVWHAEYEPLHVESSADCPGYVRLLTKTPEATKFWGNADPTMPADMARALGEALIACAKEQNEEGAK